MSTREAESLSALFTTKSDKSHQEYKILTSPSDYGVRRNLGRNGSRHAPKAIIHHLKKLNNHISNKYLTTKQVSFQSKESVDFDMAQKSEIEEITQEICHIENKNFIHIGGGHDHAYPLLMGLEKREDIDQVICLNIDAHCDTRIDSIHHSGTPFRNFDLNKTKLFEIIQIGIQDFANSKSTLSPLKHTKETHIPIEALYKDTHNFSVPPNISKLLAPFDKKRTAIFLSIDLDAIDGSFMQAVSAVNPKGLPPFFINELINQVVKQDFQVNVLGLYELNPVFDTVSNIGAKYCAELIYTYIKNS